jgi:hypothetical protein
MNNDQLEINNERTSIDENKLDYIDMRNEHFNYEYMRTECWKLPNEYRMNSE